MTILSIEEGRKLLAREPRKLSHEESNLQCRCVKEFRATYPEYKNLLFAIPNGGKRGVITASIMKREGVLAGVPDIFLAVPKNGYGGLWIEIKLLNGRTSPAQELIQGELRVDYDVETCRSVDEFMKKVKDYLG